MLNLIGVILLIYGATGVIVSILVLLAWRRPLQHLRTLFQLLARKVALGGEAGRRASAWVVQGTLIFDHLSALIAKIAGAFKQVATRFGEAASIIKSLESTLDSLKFPMLTPQIKELDLSFSVDAVSGVSLTEYNVSGFQVYGPPLKINTSPVGFDLGELPVLTGVTLDSFYPLVPVGDLFRFTGEKIETVQQGVDAVADMTSEMKDRTLEVKEKVVRTSESIKDLGDQLDEASRDLIELSQSKLFSLMPVFLLAFLAFVHFAFVLTGLALLHL